jgi:hypothetical protein
MVFSVILMAAAAAQSPLPAFLTGCWTLVEGNHWTHECWMDPKGGLMIGASREGTGDKLESWEWMSVQQGSDGTIIFYASPGGRPRTPFKLDRASATEVRFINPEHDYPQAIRYELKDGRLNAEISALNGSKAIRWSYSPDKP